MTERESIIYKIGLSFTPGMTTAMARRIAECDLDLERFFTIDTVELRNLLGLSCNVRLDKVQREEALFRAQKEMDFIERHNIRVYYIGDDDYPMLLRETPDAPVVLYQLGDTALDAPHVMNIVGTRRNTANAVSFCDTFISDLAEYFPDTLLVSGLAFGIDTLAHKGALENNLKTVAVVAHGLDTIYPAANRDLARKIIKAGGSILSEYPSGTPAYRKHFLERNRIVAGLSELTLVVESPIKGGAMSTANTAFSYSREVGAVPGRVSDEMSRGCNHLIRTHKASLVSNMADVIELMGWRPAGVKVVAKQRNLFPELSGEPKEIYDVLKHSTDPLTVDQLFQQTHIHIPLLISTLTEMEFDGIVIRHPGNRYSIA